MDAGQLMRLHYELECIGVEEDRLVRIPGAEPVVIPRFVVGQLSDGSWFTQYRDDVPQWVCDELAAISPAVALEDHEAVKRVLARVAACERVKPEKQYVFPGQVPATAFPDAERVFPPPQELVEDSKPEVRAYVMSRPAFIVRREGRIVSYCMASRENATASEAWVHTPVHTFRGRGYAQQVTLAWAHDVQQRGKVPFYGHNVENLASQGVARRLGLVQYMTDTEYYY